MTTYTNISALTNEEISNLLLSVEGINGLRLQQHGDAWVPQQQNTYNLWVSFFKRGKVLYTTAKNKKVYDSIQVSYTKQNQAITYLRKELEKIAYINR